MTRRRIVVVGAGHAGTHLVASLREQGFRGAITLLGDEPGVPYQRPPLSKDYLVSGTPPMVLPLRTRRFFADHDIEYRPGQVACAIDRGNQTVELENSAPLPYDELVLATGARARQLDFPTGEPCGVHHLRTLADAERLHQKLNDARDLVIIGAGFIGLELAAGARLRGLTVTLLETAPRVLSRAVSSVTADHVAAMHTASGTRLRLCTGARGFERSGEALSAVLDSTGERHPADLAVVGVGVRPRHELAAAAGLRTDDGIVVDAFLRTNDPHIWAIGDCARFPASDGSRRLESVQNATDQASSLARTLAGTPASYGEVPWFWSVQGRTRLQIAGLSDPGDQAVLRGRPDRGKFSVFRFRDDALTAVESIGSPAEHLAARRILASSARINPDDLDSPSFDLRTWPAPQRT